MKAIDIFCASQAATTTMDYYDIHQQPSSSSAAAAAFNGGRAIDRHNPIIQDEKRLTRTLPIPPLSTTTPDHHNNKNKKKPKNPKHNNDQKRKTIIFADENKDEQSITNKNSYAVRRQGGVLLGWGCTRPGDFISPATSSRFLLTDKALLSDQFDPLLKQVSPPTQQPATPPAAAAEKTYKSFNDNDLKNSGAAATPPPAAEKTCKPDNDKAVKKKDDGNLPSPVKTPPRLSSSLSSRSSDHQVVVLRVSLHCKGCERKMRKHISKMEGVTSFNIDFMAKKMTVVGDITPLAVLTSVSKVKNAKLLTSMTTSSPTVPQTDSNFSEIKKQL